MSETSLVDPEAVETTLETLPESAETGQTAPVFDYANLTKPILDAYFEDNLTYQEISDKFKVNLSRVALIVRNDFRLYKIDKDYFKVKRIRLLNYLFTKLQFKINKNRDIVDVVELFRKEFPEDLENMFKSMPVVSINLNLNNSGSIGSNVTFTKHSSVVGHTTSESLPVQQIDTFEPTGMVSQSIPIDSPVQSDSSPVIEVAGSIDQSSHDTIPVQETTPEVVRCPLPTSPESNELVRSEAVPVEAVDVTLPPSIFPMEITIPPPPQKPRKRSLRPAKRPYTNKGMTMRQNRERRAKLAALNKAISEDLGGVLAKLGMEKNLETPKTAILDKRTESADEA